MVLSLEQLYSSLPVFIRGVTPERAVEQVRVHYYNTRPAFERWPSDDRRFAVQSRPQAPAPMKFSPRR
jgi:hypothetical protein